MGNGHPAIDLPGGRFSYQRPPGARRFEPVSRGPRQKAVASPSVREACACTGLVDFRGELRNDSPRGFWELSETS